jgi:hypothetical protein
MTWRPAPAPVITADNEEWYLAGEPITFSGSVYYPAGALVFFNPYEMVRTGEFRGIPLYSRTTIEVYSKVYVPLSGGLMKPYERPRSGDLAGTAGSTMPAFPVATPAEAMQQVGTLGVAQAAAPPTMYAVVVGYDLPTAVGLAVPTLPPAAAAAEPEPPRGPLASAREPEGLNALFVEYRDRRWLSSGRPVPLDASRFRRIGDLAGFPVYALREGDEKTIYVAVSREASASIAPYSAGR